MAEFTSYKHKLIDFGMKKDSFKDETGKVVNYTQPVIKLMIDGEPEEIVLSGATAPKPKLLALTLRAAESRNAKPKTASDDDLFNLDEE